MTSGSTGSQGAFVSSRCRDRDAHAGAAATRLTEREAGFSLIEVLAALVILAAALSTLYPTFGSSLRALQAADGHLAARQLAQSLIEEQTLAREVRNGETRGRLGDYRWSVSIAPADEELVPDPGAGKWRLHRLAVEVAWGEGRAGRSFRLETLQLAKSP